MAILEVLTVSDLVKRVHFAIANTSTVDSALTDEIKAALHWTMRRMVAHVDHPAFRMEEDLTLVASTQDYDLALDFQRIIDPGVRLNQTPFWTLTALDLQDFDRVDGTRWNQTTSRPTHYSILGRDPSTGLYQIRFFPTPDAAYPIKYRYFAYTKPIIKAGDTELIDRRFPRDSVDGLVYGASLHFPDYLSSDKNALYSRLYAESVEAMATKAEPHAGRSRKVRGGIGGGRDISRWRTAWPDALSGTDLPTS